MDCLHRVLRMPCFIGNILRIVWTEQSHCCEYSLFSDTIKSTVYRKPTVKSTAVPNLQNTATRWGSEWSEETQSCSTINYLINLWCPSMCHTSFGPAQLYILRRTPRATVARFITPRGSTLRRDDRTLCLGSLIPSLRKWPASWTILQWAHTIELGLDRWQISVWYQFQ